MAKAAMKLSSIWQRGEINTLSLLLMFLLSIASFTFGSLYFESQHKNKLLSSEVQKLKNSQVLLMVPDKQAEVMAKWMAENPHFVSSFVDKAKQGESTVLPIGPGALQQSSGRSVSLQSSDLVAGERKAASISLQQPKKIKPILEQQQTPKSTAPAPKQSITLSESADGVKLISLPHGGIRVTTREPGK